MDDCTLEPVKGEKALPLGYCSGYMYTPQYLYHWSYLYIRSNVLPYTLQT